MPPRNSDMVQGAFHAEPGRAAPTGPQGNLLGGNRPLLDFGVPPHAGDVPGVACRLERGGGGSQDGIAGVGAADPCPGFRTQTHEVAPPRIHMRARGLGPHLGIHAYPYEADPPRIRTHPYGADPHGEGYEPRGRRPVLLPDRYDGSSPWPDYLMHFESVAGVNGWSEAEKVGYLASHLRGSAQEAFTDLSPEDRRDYASILGYFERQFGVTSRVPLRRAQLAMRIRGRGESLEELGRSIRRLVLQSYPALPGSAREDLAVEAFRNALGDEQLQRHVFASRATTLAEAVTLATELEAFLESQAHQRRGKFGAKEVRVVEESPAGVCGARQGRQVETHFRWALSQGPGATGVTK